MRRIDGHNRPNQNTTLADRRKAQNGKHIEPGQTITTPTGDPKLRERTTTVDFSQPKPVVTNPQVQPSADDIALLNQQNTLAEQNRKIEEIKKQIESDEKKLAQMNRDENPGKYDDKARKIKDKKAKLTKLYDDRAGIETKIEKTKNNILKANEPAPAGDPLGMKNHKTPTTAEVKPPRTASQKAMYDKVWKEELMPKMEAGFKANENKLTQSVLPSTGIAPNRNFIAEANEAASNHKASTPAPTIVEVKPPQTVTGNAEIPTIQNESVVKPEASTAQIPQESKPISSVASEAEAVTPKPKLKPEAGKSSKGFWGKIFKSKGGRIGAGVALTAAVAYGAYKLFGGDDNKNAEVKQNNPVQEQKATAPADTTATQKETPVAEEAKPEVKSETNTEAKPVVTPVPVAENDSIAKADAATEAEKADDAKAVVAKPETEETEEAEKTEKTEEAKEAEEAKKAEEEFNEWIAQKGENYWKYAKQELIFEHQGQAGYKPTNKEISERMLKIMERNGVNFANDGIHSDPMLKIGDKVKVKFGTEEKAA